ncbi:MAG: DUF3347 domain-containing protein [Oligoflexia bacterium]|nr:DUF3347 domain-containing protein [Oligoflexia bacterium]
MKNAFHLLVLALSFSLLPQPALAAGGPDLLAPYLTIQETLAKDSVEGVAEAARALEKASSSAPGAKEIATAARTLAHAKTLADARNGFKQLSAPMTAWAATAKPAEVQTVYCSMAKAKWLQKKGAIRNPYYGTGMLECGELQKN